MEDRECTGRCSVMGLEAGSRSWVTYIVIFGHTVEIFSTPPVSITVELRLQSLVPKTEVSLKVAIHVVIGGKPYLSESGC